MESVEEGSNVPTSATYRCRLEKKYIAHGASIVQNKSFESDVCKIQKSQQNLLSRSEKEAMRALKTVACAPDEESTRNSLSIKERIAKMIDPNAHDYINCDFIHRSAAE
eukprot:IDg616t1